MLGRLFLEHGAVDAAIAWLERALDLDPAALDINFELARAHALARRWDATDAYLARTADGGTGTPHAVFDARYAVWRGLRDPSWASRAQQHITAQPGIMYTLLVGIIRTGAIDPAVMASLERVAAGTPRLETMSHQIRAEAYLAVGDTERALGAFARALDTGLLDLAWADHLPLADRVRATDQRWAALRARVAERVAPALDVAATLGLLSRASA
jgi:tetratricopeptide (TPR) repeat protein